MLVVCAGHAFAEKGSIMAAAGPRPVKKRMLRLSEKVLPPSTLAHSGHALVWWLAGGCFLNGSPCVRVRLCIHVRMCVWLCVCVCVPVFLSLRLLPTFSGIRVREPWIVGISFETAGRLEVCTHARAHMPCEHAYVRPGAACASMHSRARVHA